MFLTFQTCGIGMHAQNDSIYKNVNLQEFTVKGSSIKHYSDRDVWMITDDMRKNTVSAYDLLEKIPGVVLDKATKKLKYKGGEKILITIDGREKGDGYAGEMGNLRFKKIEVYEHPTGRFDGYDVVFNFITLDGWRGYDLTATGYVFASPSVKHGDVINNANPSLSYTYTRSKFDFAAHYDYQHQNAHDEVQTDMMQAKDVFYHSFDTDRPGKMSFINKHAFKELLPKKAFSIHWIRPACQVGAQQDDLPVY